MKKYDGVNPVTGEQRNDLIDYVLLIGPKAFTSNAFYQTILSQHRAIYRNQKTYIVYQADPPNLDPYAQYFDHVEKRWSTPVKIGTNPLSTDAHGSPAMIFDAQGYIHVVWGVHNSAYKHAKSTNPEDISSWTQKSDISGNWTYPWWIRASNGDLYLFARYYRGTHGGDDLPFYYIKSTDNGGSFASKVLIIDPEENTRVYVCKVTYDSANNRVHFVWVLQDFSGNRETKRRVFHAYLNLSDGHMYSMDGTDLGATVTWSEMTANCTVFDGGSNNTCDGGCCKVNSQGYAMILFKDKSGTPNKFKFTKWNGSAWTSPVQMKSGEESLGSINHSLEVISDSNLRVYCGTKETGDQGYVCSGWTLFQWESTNGGSSWGAIRRILTAEMIGALPWFPILVKDAVDELKLIIIPRSRPWGDEGFPGAFGLKERMWAWGEDGSFV